MRILQMKLSKETCVYRRFWEKFWGERVPAQEWVVVHQKRWGMEMLTINDLEDQ